MTVRTAFDLLGTSSVLVCALLALCLPTLRRPLAIAAMCQAAALGLRAAVVTLGEQLIARRSVLGLDDPSTTEQILGEAYADGLPRLAFASGALVFALGTCWFAVPKMRTRVAALATTAVLLAPMAWLGTRGIGLHERTVQQMFAAAAPTDEGCLALADAVKAAEGIDGAARYEPAVRPLARACVAAWLADLDRGGADRERLEQRACAARGLLRIKSSSPLDYIEATGLVVAEDQKLEIAKRRALVAAAP